MLGKSTKMPGFRPGKVPMNIVKTQHVVVKLANAVLSEELDRVFGEAVMEQKLRVAGYPVLSQRQTKARPTSNSLG